MPGPAGFRCRCHTTKPYARLSPNVCRNSEPRSALFLATLCRGVAKNTLVVARQALRRRLLMTALSGNLVASKDRDPDRVALRCDDLQLTFAEFDAAAARVATLLEHAGVGPGDRVGVMLPNTPAFAIAFYGIMYRGAGVGPGDRGGGIVPNPPAFAIRFYGVMFRGAVGGPMNPLLKSREVSYY